MRLEDLEALKEEFKQKREDRREWERKKAAIPRCTISDILTDFQQSFPEDKELQELFHRRGWFR